MTNASTLLVPRWAADLHMSLLDVRHQQERSMLGLLLQKHAAEQLQA